MGEVVILNVDTTLDLQPERVLDGAKSAGLADVVVCGVTNNGELWVGSSSADTASILLTLERAKAFCIRQIDGE